MLHYINHNVKQAELYQKLMEYKSRLDLSALEKKQQFNCLNVQGMYLLHRICVTVHV